LLLSSSLFGPKREEVAGGWRGLHNEDLHNLYASPNVVRVIKQRRMRWAGHVACIGEMRNAYKILVGETEGKRSLRRWEDNISIDLRMGICGLDASGSGWRPVVGSCQHGIELWGSVRGEEFLD
jgi:hypothetical protein